MGVTAQARIRKLDAVPKLGVEAHDNDVCNKRAALVQFRIV